MPPGLRVQEWLRMIRTRSVATASRKWTRAKPSSGSGKTVPRQSQAPSYFFRSPLATVAGTRLLLPVSARHHRRSARRHGRRCRARTRDGLRLWRRRGRRRVGYLEPKYRQQLGLELGTDVGVLLEKQAGVFAPLADALFAEGEPGAGLLHHALVDGVVEQLTLARDPLVVEDVELRLAERGRDLVLHHLYLGAVADRAVSLFERGDAADIEANRGVDIERAAGRRGFGRPEHYAYLHADLVDEYHARLALRDRAGELAQRLRHEPGLEADVRVAHLALDLRARHQGRHRVDHHHVHRARAHQVVGDLEGFLAGVGLSDVQVGDVHAQL